jgi:alpha-ketoglutarate-dependent 2,4-dichlorophenoxyacetate dioxygenase
MPGTVSSRLSFQPLHPTFACEVTNLDLSQPISDSDFAELEAALHKYGVVVVRKAALSDDKAHVDFSRRFGDVEVSKYRNPHMRALDQPEIFDISNLDEKNQIVTNSNERRTTAIRGNALWHADGSFNPRRTYVSCLRAVELPPKGMGGHTEYADARQAYEDLPEAIKNKINDLVVAHSFLHNRQTANPDSELFKGRNVLDEPLAYHKLVTIHEPTGKPMLYITSYCHHIEGMPIEEGQKLLQELAQHAAQKKYVFEHHWEDNGDVAIWDNTAVLHRATSGMYEGKHRRDMRRTCVHDSGKFAYGLNNPEDAKNQRASS